MKFNLLKQKDTQLIGTIGEIIAWKYLWRKGIQAHQFGQSPLAFLCPLPIESWSKQIELLQCNKKQAQYLENLSANGEYHWDLIGTNPKKALFYVIDAKTTRSEERKHRLISSSISFLTKNELPADPDNARKAGFIPLLIIVNFLTDWNLEVIEREL